MIFEVLIAEQYTHLPVSHRLLLSDIISLDSTDRLSLWSSRLGIHFVVKGIDLENSGSSFVRDFFTFVLQLVEGGVA